MGVIETKADLLMALIYDRKTITTKEAATELQLDEAYIRRVAYVLEKNGLISLKATSFSLTLLAPEK